MTVDKQPRALYLADVLAAGFECDQEWYEIESAKELRRLHALNTELLEALQSYMAGIEAMGWNTDKAKAAIAKATGEQQ